nr:uncharacterized protein LOC112786356 isoform X1 [Arachis hypogaea]
MVQRPTRDKKVGKMGVSTSNVGGNALYAKDTAMTVPGTRFSILQQEENDVLQNNHERLPNYVEKENIVILSQSQPSSRTCPNSPRKTTQPRVLPAQNQTSKQAQNASPSQNPKMTPQQTPPLCDVLTQPNFAPTHNPVPNQTTSSPTMKQHGQDNDHVPTNPLLLNRSTLPHHHSVNWQMSQDTSQDTEMKDTFVPDSAMLDDRNEYQEPKPPDFSSVGTDFMLEAINSYEEEVRLKLPQIVDKPMVNGNMECETGPTLQEIGSDATVPKGDNA